MDIIWKSSDTTRHLLVMSVTELLQVTAELLLQQTFSFVTNLSLAFIQYYVETKCVDNCTFQCDVGVCVNHGAI